MNQKDIYKDKFKALFSEHDSPIPDKGWERLEQSLDASKRANIMRRYWYIGSAAAVAVLLVTSILFMKIPQKTQTSHPLIVVADKQRDTSYHNYDKSTQHDLTNKGQIVLDGQNEYNNKKHAKRETNIIKNKRSLLASKTNKSNPDPDELLISQELSEISNTHQQSTVSTTVSTIENDIQLSQEEINQLIAEFENAGNINLFNDYEAKEESPIMLAISTGGGLSNSRTIANNPMRLRSVLSDDPALDTDGKVTSSINNSLLMGNNATFNATNIADNKAELSHAQPVSFGITVSKNVYERLSIETGLVYTYLYSKSKNNSSIFSNKETQNFHYLGVPLNFNYYFLNIGDLGLFATIGGMVEKDIYGDYRSMGESVSGEPGAESREMITKKISQKNPQFSVKASLGASYPLYKGLNLYGRFGGTYYFDANNYEYKTIYSDKKIMLDLNIGVRFDF